jgi:hypothetical protein
MYMLLEARMKRAWTHQRPGMQFKLSVCVRFSGDSSTECHESTWPAFWQDFGARAETF